MTQRVYSKLFRNVALYAYYEGGKRLPAPNNGNILSAAFSGGWFWYIPLSPTLTSVGAVVDREHAKAHSRGHEAEAMQRFIDSCPIVKTFSSDASRITQGEYGKFRVRSDYSYCSESFWAPGMVLVGDAACFVDPVFSSGVHLLHSGALLAARSINSTLEGASTSTRRSASSRCAIGASSASFISSSPPSITSTRMSTPTSGAHANC